MEKPHFYFQTKNMEFVIAASEKNAAVWSLKKDNKLDLEENFTTFTASHYHKMKDMFKLDKSTPMKETLIYSFQQ